MSQFFFRNFATEKKALFIDWMQSGKPWMIWRIDPRAVEKTQTLSSNIFSHLNLFTMKTSVLFKVLFTAMFTFVAFSVSFAQVGGAGGDKAPSAVKSKAVSVSLSDMLVVTEVAAQPLTSPKRKQEARLKSGKKAAKDTASAN